MDHRFNGDKVDVEIFDINKKGEVKKGSPLQSFTIQPGECYIVFEHQSEIRAEKAKLSRKWVTQSGFYVSPHVGMKRRTQACPHCPY